MALIQPLSERASSDASGAPPSSSSSSSSSSSTSASASPPPSDLLAGWATRPASSKTFSDTLSALTSTPLFTQDAASVDQTTLDALSALAFDGTPDQVATNFKSQGNTHFLSKRYRDALGFYTQALDANPTDTKLLESLYANRAACHLELHNFAMCLKDTSKTLQLNQHNAKAYYRAAKALVALERYDEAQQTCDHALEFDKGNDAIRAIKTKAQQLQDGKTRREAETKERQRRKSLTDAALHQAFLARGLWLETTPRPPDNPTPAHFDPESLPAPPPLSSTEWTPANPITTPLILPVFFLYPTHAQSDLIQAYHEDTPIHLHLDAMFPNTSQSPLVPWDARNEFKANNLNVYVTTHAQRLLKVGKKLTLRQVMDMAAKDGTPQHRDGMVLKDGVLSLVVLPKGEPEKKWIDEFKRHRDAK
ncbi:HSP70/90 co-chaperone [Thecaphora frezii]